MDRLPCVWVDENLAGLQSINKFWTKVKAVDSGCWEWQGYRQVRGYGRTYIAGKGMTTHRAAWKLTRFYIPPNHCICHKCDNTSCCNPGHLFIGTVADNNADMRSKGRNAKGDRQGSRLHPETRPRGNDHHSRKHPERMSRGDSHYSRLHPERLARGERHAGAKLKTEDVVEIRQRWASGEQQTVLARVFGVSIAVVNSIVHRRIWKHVA